MTREEILSNLSFISNIITDRVDSNDLLSLQEKLEHCISLQGLVSDVKSECYKLVKDAELIAFEKIDKKLPASMQSKQLDILTGAEKAIYIHSDRICASISHSIEGLRTLISIIKTQIEKGI